MGFREPTRILQITKKDKNSIEIYSSSEQEEDKNLDIVTNDYLFYKVLSQLPADIKINFCDISDLQLSRCKLTDLPMNFGLLNLKQLNLSHNELEDVPACLYSGLKYLEDLNLSHNSISTFHREPECLLNIKKLKLNDNCFDTLPKWVLMFKSTNLEQLNFSTNKAVHYRYLKNSYNLHIMRLKKLKLKNSHLIDDDFNFLKCFEQLQYLDFSNKHNKYINKHYEVDELFYKPIWRQLKVLKMNNLSIAMFPEGITKLASLTELHMNNNCISWLPNGIELMVNLAVLDISRNDIIAFSEKLTKILGLEVLKASNNYIESVPDFTLMPSLRVLDLYDNLLEEVSYNHEFVQRIDLENNYLDTKILEDPRYVEKRDELRLQERSTELRLDGPKLRESANYDQFTYIRENASSEDSGDDLGDECDDCDETATKDNNIFETIQTNDVEDWDSPSEEIARNPQIDSVDEEWKGFENTSDIRTVNVIRGVYKADEDWMFVDVE